MIAIFDLDGTLALNDHRQHFLEEKPKNWKAFYEACGDDKPNVPLIKLWHNLRYWDRFILSGRTEETKYDTIEWLKAETIDDYDGLFMRRRRDNRDDALVKKDFFYELIKPYKKRLGNILFKSVIVFDDRQKVVDMWRLLGLTCCQVAPGNF